jgi:hypothetical protein
VETCGKFSHVAHPGFNCIFCCVGQVRFLPGYPRAHGSAGTARAASHRDCVGCADCSLDLGVAPHPTTPPAVPPPSAVRGG